MKRLLSSSLTLGAALLACATSLPSVSRAQTIECAAAAPAKLKGHWYYRIIDGRKCWYEGKPMMPKESLRWPDESAAKETAATEPVSPEPVAQAKMPKPSTDGRNVVPPPADSVAPAAPTAWPTPVVEDTSFESRWRGLNARGN